MGWHINVSIFNNFLNKTNYFNMVSMFPVLVIFLSKHRYFLFFIEILFYLLAINKMNK